MIARTSGLCGLCTFVVPVIVHRRVSAPHVPTPNLTLRSYTPADLAAMYALDVACFARPFRFTRAAMRRYAESPNARVLIADLNTDANTILAGFIILHVETAPNGRAGYIMTLDVDPSYRRLGIAARLMAAAERDARAQNCAALVLHVHTANAPAVAFYERIGFTRSHRVQAFYGPSLDAFVYHKLLLPPI